MPSSCDPFRQSHRRFIADTVLSQFSDISPENMYLCIGKITSWGGVRGTGDIPVASLDTVTNDIDFWRGLIAAKRINRSDISLVVPRIDWSVGTVYTAYRNTIDLFDDFSPANFYALVDEERVYVCIDNNLGSPSTVPPTHTDSVVRKLTDGYRWKFLYSIPESKRKFLTKSRVGSIGFMPVEYVEFLRSNDDRILQWNTQQAAVNGKIEFAYIDEAARAYWVTTPSCVLPSSSNVVITNQPPGATTVTISSPELTPTSSLYTDMVISFDSGAGQGQRRSISSYEWLGSTAKITVEPLVIGVSGSSDPTKQTTFSIQPKISVNGDGSSYSNTNNPTIRTADFRINFGETADVTGSCNILSPRYIRSIEVVDGGQNYTFAELNITKGLTTLFPTNPPLEYSNLRSVINAVIPPLGGHGANAVRELGAAAYMIVKDFDRDENGLISVNNDFRQVGILRNPLLTQNQARLKFVQAGAAGAFIAGGTAGQIGGPLGTVVSWRSGRDGQTATNELVLTNILGGTFSSGGTMDIGGLSIFSVENRVLAGTEGRHLLNLTMVPVTGSFFGGEYQIGNYAHGVGNRTSNIPQSRSTGEIYGWNISPGTFLVGNLRLENVQGKFSNGESILETRPFFDGSNGSTGPGKVYSSETELVGVPSTYDLTTNLTISGANFNTTTFNKDTFVTFATGNTSGNGYIIDWIHVTGSTGELKLAGVQGIVATGQSFNYSGIGASGTSVEVNGIVYAVNHRSDLRYMSGEVLYIQNIKPIIRNLEQREEIKLVVEF